MKITNALAIIVAVTLPPLTLATETVYVIDKLLVGVHKEADLNSAIAKVLPTGTKLDLLTRKGELAQIKDHEGAIGWVDNAYLMKDPPAAAAVEQLKLDKRALADRVKALETQTAGKATPEESAKINTLTNENTELKGQLSAQKLTNTALEEKLAQLEKQSANTSGGTVAAELQKANLALKEDLKKANDTVDTLRAGAPETAATPTLRSPGLSFSAIALTVALSLIGFGGGMFLMDYLHRRRHGGFRV
jgi:SH3 domain protein